MSPPDEELARPYQEAEAERHPYQEFFEAAPDGYLATTLDGTLREINPAAAALLHTTPAALVGQSLFAFLVVDNLPQFQAELARLQEGAERLDREVVLRSPSGLAMDVALTVVAFRDARDKPAGLLWVVRDITECRLQDQALAAQACQQATVAGLGQQALAGLDLDPLLEQVVVQVARCLNVPFCGAFELLAPDTLRLRAGVGWQEGRVGQATFPAATGSPVHPSFLDSHPLVLDGLMEKTQVTLPALFADHGISWGLSVVVPGPEQPFGILGVFTTDGRSFTGEDANFLQGVANILTTVLKRARAEEALRASEERFRAVAETANDAVISGNSAGIITYFNKAAQRIFGYSEAEAIGRPITLLMPERFQPLHEGGMARFLATRKPRLIGRTVELTGTRKDGREFPLELSLAHWEAGSATHFTGMIRDISERKQAENALRRQTLFVKLLQVVAVAANEASTPEEAFQTALDQVCAHTDWPVGHVYVPAQDGTGELVSANLWHLDDRWRFAFLRKATEASRFGPGVGLPGRVLASGQPAWVGDVTQDENFPRAGETRGLGVKAAFAFPVLVDTEVVAVLEFFSREAVVPEQPLLEVMAHIGTQLGRVVERVRRRQAAALIRATEAELRIARDIQRRLFPDAPPVLPGFDIAGISYPAQAIGGDYYDYIALPDGGIGVVVGDVSGHGYGPALMMSQARAYLRALALMHTDIGDLLTHANHILAEDTEEGRFITLFLARLDPRTRSLQFAAAGHEAFLLPASGPVRKLASTALPLGVERDLVIPCGPAVLLQPGDQVLLFTDGIPEATGPGDAPFGIDRTLDIVRAHREEPAQTIVEALHRAVQDFTHGRTLDDLTAVVIKCEGLWSSLPT
ncbi:MAG: PAS domain S-box protein [Planctomycetes bacterium]|nr:PAS domain S-box protein [Planctomycetota bacterium]